MSKVYVGYGDSDQEDDAFVKNKKNENKTNEPQQTESESEYVDSDSSSDDSEDSESLDSDSDSDDEKVLKYRRLNDYQPIQITVSLPVTTDGGQFPSLPSRKRKRRKNYSEEDFLDYAEDAEEIEGDAECDIEIDIEETDEDDEAEEEMPELEIDVEYKKYQKKIKNAKKRLDEYHKKRGIDPDMSLEHRVLLSNLPLPLQSEIMSRLNQDMERSDYRKYATWVETILQIPTNQYKGIQFDDKGNGTVGSIGSHFIKIKEILDSAAYGQQDTKEEIFDYISRSITTKQKSSGNILALVGSPGTAKTRIIRSGLSKALDRPFHQISFGGLTDPSLIVGHSVTYIGAKMGRIAEIIIESKCMNPIIYLDEIDKIGDSNKSIEMYGILTHLLDPEQNKEFVDNYLGASMKLDLSGVLFVLALNHLDQVDSVVRDRLKIIHVKTPSNSDKIQIAQLHLIPDIVMNVGLTVPIRMSDETLKYIINNKIQKEDGVRSLRRGLETIIQKINTVLLLETSVEDFTPTYKDINRLIGQRNGSIEISKDLVDRIIRNSNDSSPFHMYS